MSKDVTADDGTETCDKCNAPASDRLLTGPVVCAQHARLAVAEGAMLVDDEEDDQIADVLGGGA